MHRTFCSARDAIWVVVPSFLFLVWLRTEQHALMVTAIFATLLMLKPSSYKAKPLQRRTSHASAIGANREALEEALCLRQNVINAILTFDEAPSRDDLLIMMTTLANKFQRMSAVPQIDARGECTWNHISDLTSSVERAVQVDAEFDASSNELHALHRAHAHIGTILTSEDEDGPLPLWRVIILSPKMALFRIDHCICDGLTAVTLLKDIGIKTSSKEPLKLSDLSPILRAIEQAGDLRIALYPLKLLWPPNLIRAIRFLACFMKLGKEPPNPLRSRPEDLGSPVPYEDYGTVYFPSMPLQLFKDIARAIGNNTTINDVLLLCLSEALGRYMDELQDFSDIDNLKLLLPIGNPIRPSLYGSYYDGLCNRMTPVIVPLDIPRQNKTNDPKQALDKIKSYMQQAKRSNTPLFMTAVNTILKPFLSLEKLKQAGKHSFESVSCVWSNVAGPTESISLTASASSQQSYKVEKIQIVMPHPVSIMTFLSYDSKLFCNITLDTRAAAQPWLLRRAFIEAVKTVTPEGVSGKWKGELTALETSSEWGGAEAVYHCEQTKGAYSREAPANALLEPAAKLTVPKAA